MNESLTNKRGGQFREDRAQLVIGQSRLVAEIEQLFRPGIHGLVLSRIHSFEEVKQGDAHRQLMERLRDPRERVSGSGADRLVRQCLRYTTSANSHVIKDEVRENERSNHIHSCLMAIIWCLLQ